MNKTMEMSSPPPPASALAPSGMHWSGLSCLYSRDRVIRTLQSRHYWNSFFDVYKYSAPPSIQEAKRRIEVNIRNYYIQYSLLFVLCLLVVIVSFGWTSILIFSLILSGVIGISYFWPQRTHALILKFPLEGVQISWQAAVSIWAFVSCLILITTGAWIILPTSLGISFSFLGLHGVFHSSEPDLSINAQDNV